MAPLRKPALFQLFEESLYQSGQSFLRLSEERTHPAAYQIMDGDKSFRLRLYIWNLTFGGRASLPNEWRIQVTGLPEIEGRQRFVPEVGGKTAILGWCDDLRVFAAYDISRHSGPLGGSPSIQIRQPALESAHINGLAHQFKGEEEVAFAVKSAYMGTYLRYMDELHACGSSDETLRLLAEICENPENIDEAEIEAIVPESRRYAVVSTKKALRDANFKDRVLTAYSHACAMCGVQLRLLDAAHILPAAHPESTDETSNGVALCALHHRAYDRGLVTFDAAYRVHRNGRMEQDLSTNNLDAGLADFRDKLLPIIAVPPAHADRPAPNYVNRVNAMRGWFV
ncbi:HNH endonuclease [Denitrobaculum tricleocarpae]|uniref:HNH endonuclease n=1 Tax=Denitrobaculum tricleocarpae TaxID=2591009 RepID=A0A545U0V8_9PROT|nr:HNH endonuclease [Denitrobaculum tricleocarpae]TQV83043.1 HNH endonuclease [Denitrobaculum tricleocarpae]